MKSVEYSGAVWGRVSGTMATTAAAIVSVGANEPTKVITSIFVTNRHAATGSIATLAVVPSGQSYSAAYNIWSLDQDAGVSSVLGPNDLGTLVLSPGEALYAVAENASSNNYHVSYYTEGIGSSAI